MSYKLSEKKMDDINKQRLMKGWNKYDKEWLNTANVGESTLKRFWCRKKISNNCFIAICKAADIEDWKTFVEWEDKDSTRVSCETEVTEVTEVTEIYISQSELATAKFTISVRDIGVFDEDEIILVNAILKDLKQFFSKSCISFKKIERFTSQSEIPKTKCIINVTGVGILSSDKRQLVKGILEDLQSFLRQTSIVTSIVTMKPVLEDV